MRTWSILLARTSELTFWDSLCHSWGCLDRRRHLLLRRQFVCVNVQTPVCDYVFDLLCMSKIRVHLQVWVCASISERRTHSSLSRPLESLGLLFFEAHNSSEDRTFVCCSCSSARNGCFPVKYYGVGFSCPIRTAYKRRVVVSFGIQCITSSHTWIQFLPLFNFNGLRVFHNSLGSSSSFRCFRSVICLYNFHCPVNMNPHINGQRFFILCHQRIFFSLLCSLWYSIHPERFLVIASNATTLSLPLHKEHGLFRRLPILIKSWNCKLSFLLLGREYFHWPLLR